VNQFQLAIPKTMGGWGLKNIDIFSREKKSVECYHQGMALENNFVG
jgi:hypothetical protein